LSWDGLPFRKSSANAGVRTEETGKILKKLLKNGNLLEF